MSKNTNHQQRYTILMVFVAMLWGFGFVATQKALDGGYSASFMMTVRFGLSAIIFGMFCGKELFSVEKREIAGGALCGIFLFAGFALQTYGLPLTTPSNNALITTSSVMFVPLFVWLIFKQRPTKRIALGAAVCFLGIVILSVDVRNLSHFNVGDLFTFACAIAFALHNVTTGYFAVFSRPQIINFYQMLVATVLSLVMFLISPDKREQLVMRPEFIWVLYLAIFSTLIAYFIQTKAMKHLASAKVAIISASESVIAAVFSILLGYESVKPTLIIGGTMVIVAILLVEINPRSKEKAA